MDRTAFRRTFQKVFYVREENAWYDYNLKTKKHNLRFYPSSFVPLFAGCYHSLNQAKVEKIFRKMDQAGAFNFTGGIPAR